LGEAAKSHPDCKENVGKRFVELAEQTGADIVFSCMLADNLTTPSQLKDFGLAEGWTQVDGPCDKPAWRGDTTALAFGPGWRVDKSGAGCRAVALVEPPSPIQDCPKLCVLGVHAPHQAITQGNELVVSVCGAAAKTCSIAMGDWNIDASNVGKRWTELIGKPVPEAVVPDSKTCCWPESKYGVDFPYDLRLDHVATNVQGAHHVSHQVHDYQHTNLTPWDQHKPVSAHLELPSAPSAEGAEDM